MSSSVPLKIATGTDFIGLTSALTRKAEVDQIEGSIWAWCRYERWYLHGWLAIATSTLAGESS